MRILFLSGWLPYPPNNGSKLRILNLLRGLAEYHEVTLLAFHDGVFAVPAPLESFCRQIVLVRREPYDPGSLRSLAGLLGSKPRAVAGTHSKQMARLVGHALAFGDFDLVVASQWMTAEYLPAGSRIPAILEELEPGAFRTKQLAARTALGQFRHQLTVWKLGSYLRSLLPRYSACTVVSEQEAALLRELAPDTTRIEVVPNMVRAADYQRVTEPRVPNQLIFSGSLSYSANYDGVNWLLRESYPRIQEAIPNVSVVITGDNAGMPLPAVQGVRLTGMVDDPRPLVAASQASVVPIRRGGGTRLKILESAALGTPVVATPKGADGLDFRHEEHLLLAEGPEEFAGEVIRLLREPLLQRRLGENARARLLEKYDYEAVIPHFLGLVDEVTGYGWRPGARTTRAAARA